MTGRLIFLVVGIIALVSLLNSRLELKRETFRHRNTKSANALVSLNLPQALKDSGYRVLVADSLWILTIIENGEIRRSGRSDPQGLLTRGYLLTDVDPFFYPAYIWIPAAFIGFQQQVSELELRNLSEFLDRGIETFPNDVELPYSAALNFVGYSDVTDRARRARELKQAIGYLHIAMGRPNPPETIPGLLNAFHRRIGENSDSSPSADNAFLYELARAGGLGHFPGLLDQLSIEQIETLFAQALEQDFEYLEFPLSATIASP